MQYGDNGPGQPERCRLRVSNVSVESDYERGGGALGIEPVSRTRVADCVTTSDVLAGRNAANDGGMIADGPKSVAAIPDDGSVVPRHEQDPDADFGAE